MKGPLLFDFLSQVKEPESLSCKLPSSGLLREGPTGVTFLLWASGVPAQGVPS